MEDELYVLKQEVSTVAWIFLRKPNSCNYDDGCLVTADATNLAAASIMSRATYRAIFATSCPS